MIPSDPSILRCKCQVISRNLLGYFEICHLICIALQIDDFVLQISAVILRLILTHWGRVTHICVGKLINIGSDNGLSPGRRQAIIWTNAGILLIGPLGTNFSEFLIVIHTCSFNKMHLKMSSAKWRPFCPGLNVLKKITPIFRDPFY